jgi:transposase-like protein
MPFNSLPFPTAIVLLVVSGRLRYKLSRRDLAEMFLERASSPRMKQCVRGEARFAPRITGQLRAKRKGKTGGSWYVGEVQPNPRYGRRQTLFQGCQGSNWLQA